MIYWNNQPSPYFVRRMNTLHDRGNVAIEAWFSEVAEPGRDWAVDPEQWRFRARMLSPGHRRAVQAVSLLRRERPDVFVTLYGDYAFASAVLAAKAQRTAVVIHALRTFGSWRRRSALREGAKHALFRLADAVQVAGPDSRAYAEGYGAASNRIFAIREEVDVEFWTLAEGARSFNQRELRSSNRLSGCVFLYVGRLWRGKGIDVLIDAYESLRRDSIECSLVIAGAGEEEGRLRARTKAMDRVVFAGFVEGAALRDWYHAADVLVFPTLGDAYGLVVLEAMACGLPVIATTAAGTLRTESSTAKQVTSYLPTTRDPSPDECESWPPIRDFEGV